MSKNLEKFIVLISFMSSIIGVFVINGVIIGVPEIANEFGMNNVVQNWIPTIFVFAVTMLTIPAGQLAGKIGFKKSLIIGNVIKLIGFIGIVFAFSTETFLLFRLLQGIGVAFANVSELAIIVLGIREEHRGRSLGITATGVYIGTSAAPVICGFLVQNFGWRSMFYIAIPFLILCILLMIFKLDTEWNVDENIKIDKFGSILYMMGVFLFVYGFTDLLTVTGKIAVVIGIVFLISFVLYELRSTYPVFNVRLFKNRPFASYNIAGLCGYFAVMVVTTILNYHFQYVRGWDAQLTGLILIISPIVMSITAVNAGRLFDKYHPQKIATIGMFIAIFAFVLLSFLNEDTPLYIVVVAMILQALGMGLFSSPNMNAIMSSVSEDDVSHASGAQITMRAIGQTMSLALLTLVFSWVMGGLAMSLQYADMIVRASQIICLICALACVLAVAVSIFGIKSENAVT
jgi:MFS family permease